MFWSRRAITVTGLVALAAFLPGPAAQAGEVRYFHPCGSSDISRVEIAGCDESPCTFYKGDTYKLSVTFVPDRSSNDIALTGTARYFSIPMPLLGSQDSGSDIGLPSVTAGQAATFTKDIKVPDLYPFSSATESWNLTADGSSLVCFDLPIQVRAKTILGDL